MSSVECRMKVGIMCFIRHSTFDIRHLLLACLFSLPAFAADPSLPGEVTKIAFGSCLRQDKPAPILDAIVDAKPDVFIWLGDNIYADSDDPAVVQSKYELLGNIEGFKKLRAAVPFLYVWDDHDYGKNDAGVEYAFKDQNKRLMLDFFHEPPNSERRRREGNYDAKIIGPAGRRVQFLLLDTRSFRSPMKSETRDGKKWYVPTDDPSATVLGDAQWQWLEAQLKEPAEIRVVCSSIQVIPTEQRFEKWENFPKERTRLIELLKPHAPSTLILSGDRHHGSIHRDRESGLEEITASALNQPGTPTAEDLHAATKTQEPVAAANFGFISIDWRDNPRPTFAWELRTFDQHVHAIHHHNSTAIHATTAPAK
jgi:alkaline phosphatase D